MYVDESGDLGSMPANLAPNGNDQPVLAIGALLIDAAQLHSLTHNFLQLKNRFYPSLSQPGMRHLDMVKPEVKGADVRRHAMRSPSRNVRRHAVGFMDGIIALLEKHDVKLLSRIWIKPLGTRPSLGVYVFHSVALHVF